VFYFRKGDGPRTRLPDVTDPAFEEAYQRARASLAAPRPPKVDGSTLSWLIARYERSAAYAALSPATRRQRDNIFRHAVRESGSFPFREITADHLRQARERRKDTPAQARNVLDAYRGLFRWALDAGHVDLDPTEGVRNPTRRAGPGFAPWTAKDVEVYRRRWKPGTVQRLWLEVLLGTGLRRGDAVKIGWPHVRHRFIAIETEKKGVVAFIPFPSGLARELKRSGAGRRDTWIVGDRGNRLTKESFGNLFRAACDAAGLTGKSAHGLRKLAATMDAERGLTVEQMKAVYGWTSDAMASHYTRSADRLVHAMEAAKRRR
jgi:integrase